MDDGRIVAIGTPRELQERTLGQSTIEMSWDRPVARDAIPQWAEAVTSTLSEGGRGMVVISSRPARTLVEMVKWVDQAGLEIEDVRLKRPTLEDVYIELTGKRLRE